MNQKQIQQAIKRLKQELSNANYFVSGIVPMPKDRQTAKNLVAARMTLANMENIVKELTGLEKELQTVATNKSDESFKKRLGTINSPTDNMRRTAEQFLESSKTPNILIKKAMAEQIRKASLENDIRSASTSRRAV